MRERLLRIGQPEPLTTIASIPSQNSSNDLAIIIVNSGVMHHIGTCRMSVRIARDLAANGFLALRFDFSGIGDSPPRSGTLSFTESAAVEIREVMNYLQKTKGIKRFILMGLCSGADAIYESAIQEERVVGMCQIDPYCYRTTHWKINYWLSRITSLNHWILYFKYHTGLIGGTSNKSFGEENIELPTYIRNFPAREEVSAGLTTLFKRNMKLLALFTNGQPKHYNYKNQFTDSMPEVDFKDLFTTEYYPHCTHIIAEPDQQALIINKIVEWVELTENLVAKTSPIKEISDEVAAA